jgi:hypothetical protein
MASELSPSLIRFIRASVPTYQAVEVLLFFATHRQGSYTPEELVAGIRPTALTVPAVCQYASLFAARGLLVEQEGRYAYAPGSSEVEDCICELALEYNERPVTLIKVMYSLTDGSIRSFADAFDFRKDRKE